MDKTFFNQPVKNDIRTNPAGRYWLPGRSKNVPLQRPPGRPLKILSNYPMDVLMQEISMRG